MGRARGVELSFDGGGRTVESVRPPDQQVRQRTAEAVPWRGAPIVIAGVAVGTVEVALAASLAALIWAGPLDVHLPRAVGLGLFAAMVLLAVISLRTTFPGTLGSVQDVPAAILAVVAASVASRFPPAAEETFLTIAVAIALTSVSVGVFFWLLGRLRLGNLVRYVPYPVVGGFLGGTGVLLAVGALGVVMGDSASLAGLQAFSPDMVARWAPAVLFAGALVVATRRGWHFLFVPGLFVGCVVVFHLLLLATGGSIADAQTAGWLLGPFPDEALWQPWHLSAVGQVDWALIVRQLPAIGTIVVFSALGLLLNAGAIEISARADIDLDGELRAAGIANIAAGLGGGTPGYHAVSLSALAYQMHARHRAVGLVAAAVCAGALVTGAGVLALFPRFVVGGLVLFVGLMLVIEWLYDTWRRLPRAEYAVLAMIVAIIATRGFVPGVLVGLVAAVVLFLISYSRVDVVKHDMTGRDYRSNVDRSTTDLAFLRDHGDEIQILTLHGFLFFGTANALFERVRTRANDAAQAPLRFLVLDFRRVTGLDSSALQSFAKILSLADRLGIAIVMTGLTPRWRALLEDSTGDADPSVTVMWEPDVDRGVQWCEERLLGERHVRDGAAAFDWGATSGGFDLQSLRPFLECIDAAKGDVLIRQGDHSSDLYLLAAGRLTAQVTRDNGETVRLRTISAGSVVGELGMYLGTARTASVVADTPSTVYRLSQSALEDLEANHPEVAAGMHAWLARLMAERIADNVRIVAALLD